MATFRLPVVEIEPTLDPDEDETVDGTPILEWIATKLGGFRGAAPELTDELIEYFDAGYCFIEPAAIDLCVGFYASGEAMAHVFAELAAMFTSELVAVVERCGFRDLELPDLDEHRLDRVSFVDGRLLRIYPGVNWGGPKHGQPFFDALADGTTVYSQNLDAPTEDLFVTDGSAPTAVDKLDETLRRELLETWRRGRCHCPICVVRDDPDIEAQHRMVERLLAARADSFGVRRQVRLFWDRRRGVWAVIRRAAHDPGREIAEIPFARTESELAPLVERALPAPTCRECGAGDLVLVTIEAPRPQLACHGCGGMFEPALLVF